MQGMRTAFPDFKGEPLLVLVSGRNLFAFYLMTGTNSGSMKMGDQEMPATNKKTSSLMFHKLAINDENKATEEWAFHDPFTMMGQLGVLPKEAGPTRPPIDKAPAFPQQIVVAADDAKEKANLDAFTKMNAAINAHKSADAVAMLADDAVESDQAEAKDMSGKKDIQKGLDEFFKAFPDVKLDVPTPTAVGDYVVAMGTMTGTNKGPMGKMKPTNKSVSGGYAEVIAFKDGKATNLWRFRNGMDMAKQLGLLPDAKAAPMDAPKSGGAGKKK
jgi:predicted ester cyclase